MENKCICYKPPINYNNFDSKFIGRDIENNTFAEVFIEKCKTCGTVWPVYSFEVEAFSTSGRWYRGIIDNKISSNIKPEDAKDILESLPWLMYGGSYYSSIGKIGRLFRIY